MQIDRILGNVGVLYVGAYNSSTQYEYLNCVTYNGSSYVCVNQNGVTGVTPGTTNDWQLSAQKGDTGGQGIQGEQGIQGATGNGIQSIEKTSSNALTDTYTILFTDGSSTTFEVENGKGIVSIEKTSTEDNVDTYTITYNDNTTSTFTVTNGEVTKEQLENERKISDNKYAKALKTQVTDVENIQIYAENDVVDDLIIKGAPLTQEIREGYNKFYLPQTSFDIIGLNVNIKNSNELTIKGIPTSTYFIKDFIGDDFKTIIENGKTYTILAIPNFRTETTRLAYYITWYNSDSEVVYKTSPTIWLSNGKVIKVFTPEFDQEISYFRLTLEGMTKDVEYDFDLKFMMLEGEYAEDNMPEFELYGASPSLDYPSEIQVVDEQNIQIAKNNYLDTTQIANKTFSNGGLTVTTDGNGIFTVNGTHSEQVNIDFGNLDFKLRSGQKIKLININGINDTSNNLTDIIRVLFWDFYFNDVSQINMYVNIVRGGNVNRAGIRFLIPSDKTSVTYTNFKFGIMVVNADDNIQDYQPYYGTNITIPLVNSAIGQYTDTIDRENNVQNKVIQELILTGNEDFKNATYEPGEGFYAYYIKLNMLKLQNIKTFCNYFKQHNEAGDIQEECFTIPNTGNIVFIVQNYTTIEEFKTKLQELYELGKPVKVYYVAETSTPEPLSEEVKQELDKFKLYDGLNNISIDNGTLSFKYNKSLLKVLEEKDEKIDDLQSQIDEIKTLLSSTSTASLLLENLANDNESEVS